MKKNVGKMDQIIRITIGSIIIVLTLFRLVGWWGVIGLYPFITGAICYCPLYYFLNIDTTKFDKK